MEADLSIEYDKPVDSNGRYYCGNADPHVLNRFESAFALLKWFVTQRHQANIDLLQPLHLGVRRPGNVTPMQSWQVDIGLDFDDYDEFEVLELCEPL